MQKLHNIISNKKLKSMILSEKIKRCTVSFYKYFIIKNPQEFRDLLYKNLFELNVFGRIYIAYEGINAQISVPIHFYEKMVNFIYNFNINLKNIRMNLAIVDDSKSFWVLRLKVRDRIVADGIKESNFDTTKVGIYLKAHEVNNMINDIDNIFVDMRNNYEYMIGHFINSVQIPANNFREQLLKVIEILKNKKNKKIIMYCTGGIRCEKATAWMLYNGFKYIYHIEGGIIEYVRKAREQGLPVYFKGKLFTFDERMGEEISPEIFSYCYQCKILCNNYVNCNNNYCHLLFIQCYKCAKYYHNCCSIQCMETLKKNNL